MIFLHQGLNFNLRFLLKREEVIIKKESRNRVEIKNFPLTTKITGSLLKPLNRGLKDESL